MDGALATLGIHDLPLFIAAGVLLNLTPGADMLYMVGHAASGGRRAGLVAALGICAGCLFHVLLAALGLSAIFAASELAFNIVKWMGAAYLVWMGIGMLLSRSHTTTKPAAIDPKQVFWRGVLTNALNPKVALFFLAFLPQFISPGAGNQSMAFALLGLLFTLNSLVVVSVIVWVVGSLRGRLVESERMKRMGPWLQRTAGAMFVGLGVKLAIGGR